MCSMMAFGRGGRCQGIVKDWLNHRHVWRGALFLGRFIRGWSGGLPDGSKVHRYNHLTSPRRRCGNPPRRTS